MKIKFFVFLSLFLSLTYTLDTDADGYPDALEIKIGTDPNDFNNRYYWGGWSVNLEKDEIKGSDLPFSCPNNTGCECKSDDDCVNSNCRRMPRGKYCLPKAGDIFPHFYGFDQYGEDVDIYDFANQGKIIALEFGTAWCSPCNELASFLSSGNMVISKNIWWKSEYSIIKDKIDSGDIIFITILFEDESRGPAGYETVSSWHDKYPNNNIPVLADQYKDLHQWMKPTGYPCVNILDENMRLITSTGRGLSEAFDILSGIIAFNNTYRRIFKPNIWYMAGFNPHYHFIIKITY